MDSDHEVNHNGFYSAAEEDFELEAAKNGEHFIIDDLLDFSNGETMAETDDGLESAMTDSSMVTAVDTSCNSFSASSFGEPSSAVTGGDFSGGLCVPYDDLPELEWLSNIEEESFYGEDLQKFQIIQGVNVGAHHYHFQPTRLEPPMLRPIPAKARSKRSRTPPENWTSRLLVVSPKPKPKPPVVSSSSGFNIGGSKKYSPKPSGEEEEEERRCLHCATDKTPQWRTGPMGPKTLCNACGVRYKSGRLVPEYRPAASPTFVLTKHSNSHRKVLELRRQKDLEQSQQQQQQQFFHHHHHHQNVMFDVSNGEDYLIHSRVGPDFRQLI